MPRSSGGILEPLDDVPSHKRGTRKACLYGYNEAHIDYQAVTVIVAFI